MKQICLSAFFFLTVHFVFAQICPPGGQVVNPCFQTIRPVYPEQDCCGAIELCQILNQVPNNFILGPGCVNAELPALSNTCLATNERRTTWYTFEIRPLPGGPQLPGSPAGVLRVVIIPNDIDSIPDRDNGETGVGTLDYDFGLFDVSSFGENRAAACSAIKRATAVGSAGSIQLSCNYSGTNGPTGLLEPGTSNNINGSGLRFNRPIPVVVGQRFVFVVDNFSNNEFGYKIAFGNLPIPPGAPPTAIVVPQQNNQIRFSNLRTPSCSDSTLQLSFTDRVSCTTLDSNLTMTDLSNGANVLIDTIMAVGGCDPDRQDTLFKVVVQGLITGRTYKVTNTSQIRDACGITAQADTILFAYIDDQYQPIITNDGGVLNCNIQVGAQFQWFLNGLEILGANGPTHTVMAVGTYYVEVRNSSGCVRPSNELVITHSLLRSKSSHKVFPNPSHGLVNILFDELTQVQQIRLLDLNGKVVMQESFAPGVKEYQQSTGLKGVFNLEIRSKSEVVHHKLIIH